MLEGRFVTTDQGSGIVHCAPSHGPDDFNLCLNNGIKAIETVDGDGKYTNCLLYTSPSPRDRQKSRMPSSA